MNAYYDSNKLKPYEGKYLVPDTGIFTSCTEDPEYFELFNKIFENNPMLIDPIVKLEFLRGAYLENTYKEKEGFLKYEKFYNMVDHQDIYKKVYDAAFNIARIYSHNGKPDVPLGDILISARLAIYEDKRMFITLDKTDFSSLLFDRIDVVTFERETKKQEVLEIAQLLTFNKSKYEKCISNLP